MKIELKTIDIDGKKKECIGYTIIAESKEDSLVMGNVRNLHYLGFGDTYIRYDGMETKDATPEGERLVGKLKFVQEKHVK